MINFLKININYNEMLNDFFNKYPNAEEMHYDELINNYFKEGYWPSNALEKELSKKFKWECDSLVFTLEETQRNEIFFTKWCEKFNISDTYKNRLDNLLMQISFYKPDVIYIHEIWFFPAEFFANIRFLLKDVIIIGWDCAPGTYEIMSRLKYVDMVYTCIQEKEDRFIENGINALMVGHFFNKDILNTIPKEDKKYDVLFAGTINRVSTKDRMNFLKKLIEREINVHILAKTDDEVLKKHCSEPAYGNDFFRALKDAKIVLNRHVIENRKYSGNARMYETTGVGSFLLTDYKEDLCEKFCLNNEVVAYNSVDDLVEKIDYYLKNEKERESIAKKGQDKTLKNYCYDKFADLIYRFVFEEKSVSNKNTTTRFSNMMKHHIHYEKSNNAQFNMHSNNLVIQTKKLAKKYGKIALYGNGNVTKLIQSYIPNLVVIADKVIDKDIPKSSFCNPENLRKYNFDAIIITVLDREKEIESFLINNIQIQQSKIIKLKL